jgi:hypothetical protein
MRVNEKQGLTTIKIENTAKVIIVQERFEHANWLFDFLPLNNVAREIKNNNIQIMSILELEQLACSNLTDNIDNIFIEKLDESTRRLPYDKFMESLDGYNIQNNNFFELEFNSFFSREN